MTDGSVFYTPPPAPDGAADAPADAWDRVFRAARETQARSLENSLLAVQRHSPDDFAVRIGEADRLGLPADSARYLNGDSPLGKAMRRQQDYGRLLDVAPRLSEWLSDPANAGIAQDDIDRLRDLETALRGGSRGLLGDMERSAEAGTYELGAGAVTVAAAHGMLDLDDAAEMAAALNRQAREAQSSLSAESAALVERMAEAEGWDKLGVVLEDPLRGVGLLTAQSATGTLAVLGAGWTGSLTGGGAGALTGNPLIAGAGALLGGAGGAFGGGMAVEMSAWTNAALAEAGVDIYDGASLAAAYRDQALMGRILGEAKRKGLGTSGLDAALTLIPGARALKGVAKAAKPASMLRRAGRAVGEVAVESVGEAAGEAVGQYAATGEVDAGEAILEAVAALGQSVGQVAISRGAVRPARGLLDRARATSQKAVEAVQDAKAIGGAAEAHDAAKTPARSPQRSGGLVQSVGAAADLGEVRVSREDFDRIMGEDASTEAAEVARGGLAGYAASADTGDVVIPLESMLQRYGAGDARRAQIVEAARLRPDGMSLTEAGEAVMGLQAEAEKAVEEAQQGAVLEQADKEDASLAEQEKALASEVEGLGFDMAELDRAAPPPVLGRDYYEARIAEYERAAANATTEEERALRAGVADEYRQQLAALPPEPEMAPQIAAHAEYAAKRAQVATRSVEAATALEEVKGKRAAIAEKKQAAATLWQENQTAADKAIADYTDQIVAAAKGTKIRKMSRSKARGFAEIIVKQYQVLADAEGVALEALLADEQIRFRDAPGGGILHQTAYHGSPLEQTGRRGSINIGTADQFGRRIYDISLWEGADETTILHEATHAFVQALGNVASREGASERTRKLYADVLAESGYGTREAHIAAIDEIGRIHGQAAVEKRELTDAERARVRELAAPDEQIAKGFEAYMIEGKAPSAAMRRLFGMMRRWLAGIYATVKDLGVEVNPRLQSIYDRFLATDAELAAMREEQPTFRSAEELGMTPDEWAAHQAAVTESQIAAEVETDRAQLRHLSKEAQAARREKMERYKATARAELDKQPAALAYDAIQKGERPKIDRASAADFDVPADMLTDDGGQDINAAAEEYGAPSPGAFADGLRAAADRDRLAARAARQRVKDDILRDEPYLINRRELRALAEKVEAQADKLDIQHRELAALRRKGMTAEGVTQRTARWELPTVAWFRKTAEAQIRPLQLQALKPAAYRRTEARERRLAMEAVRAGRDHDAFVALRRATLNHEMYRQATALLEQAGKDERFCRSLAKKSAQETLNRAHYTYLDQVNSVLERFTFGRISDKSRARRSSLAAFIQRRRDEGMVLDVSDFVLNESTRKSSRDLSADELHAVRNALEGLWHLARNADKTMRIQRGAEISDIAKGLAAQLEVTRDPAPRTHGRQPTRAEAAGDTFSKLINSHEKAGWTFREWDKSDDGGPFVGNLFRPVASQSDLNELQKHAVRKRESALYTDNLTAEQRRTIDVRENYAGAWLSREDRLSWLSIWGSATGRQRLRNSYTPDQIKAILASYAPEEVAFVKARWALANELFDEALAVRRRTTGQIVKKLETAEATLTLTDGSTVTLAGGYFPALYREQRRVGASDIDNHADFLSGRRPSLSMNTGFFEERVPEYGGTILLNRSAFTNHLMDLVQYTNMHEVVRDAETILNHPTLYDAIHRYVGAEDFREVDRWLRRTAVGNVGARDIIEQGSGYLRRKGTSAMLTFRSLVAFKQYYGLRIAALRIGGNDGVIDGAKWILRALSDTANVWTPRKILELAQSVNDKSPHMRVTMMGGWNREVLEERTTGINRGVSRAKVAAYWLIQYAQYHVNLITWTAQYKKTMSQIPAGVDPVEWEAEAVKRAEQAVRDSQSSGQIVDLSLAESGGPLLRLWTTYFTDGGIKLNAMRSEIARFKDSAGAARYFTFAGHAAIIYMLPTAIGAMVSRMVMSALGGGDDEGEVWEADELVSDIALGSLSEMADSVIGLREWTGAIRGYPYQGPAGSGVFSSGARFIQQAMQFEADPAFWKALNDFGGRLTGLPSKAVEEAATAIDQMYNGEVPTALVGVK